MQNKRCQFTFSFTNMLEIKKLLSELKCNKPCGHDNLDNRLLKLSAEIIAGPLSHIFNLTLKEGIHPQVWKVARVTPLPKNKKHSFTGSNSRPISILPVLGKVMEKIHTNSK